MIQRTVEELLAEALWQAWHESGLKILRHLILFLCHSFIQRHAPTTGDGRQLGTFIEIHVHSLNLPYGDPLFIE